MHLNQYLSGIPYTGRYVIVAVVVLLNLCTATRLCGQQDLARFNGPQAWQDDAELTDVFFLDARTGWSVGDQGTILRTDDGGSNWRIVSTAARNLDNIPMTIQQYGDGVLLSDEDQSRPVRCRFETIFFTDRNNGWIAGGYSIPYVDRSRGFVMRTTDGGATWHEVTGLVLPRIRQIEFDTNKSGRAYGDRSSLYPAGIFVTSDGGLSWSGESARGAANLVCGIQSQQGVIAIDVFGRISVITPVGSKFSTVPENSGRIADAKMIDGLRGWAVGARGTVLVTSDGGHNWMPPTNLYLDPSAQAQDDVADNLRLVSQFDFRSLWLTESKIWIAADPGSIFSMDRKTGAIARHNTGVSTPINCIKFIDEQSGYAVGANGVVLATNNTGESWHAQRAGGQGTAILSVALFSRDAGVRSNSLAWEALAKFAGEENLLTSSLALWDDSAIDTGRGHYDSASLRQAVSRLGGQHFVDEHFHSLGSIDPLDLSARLVRRIRSLQPRVVVAGDDPAIATILANAIKAAGDPTRFPDQIELAGLRAWKVDRLATLDKGGEATVDLRQMLTRAGCLIEDQIAISRALAGLPPFPESADRFSVQHLSTAAGANSRRSGLLSGLRNSGRPLPKRNRDNGIRGTMVMIRHLSQKQNLLKSITDAPSNNADLQRNRVQSVISPLDSTTGGLWVLQIAARYASNGKMDDAARMMELFSLRYSEHALAPAALFWLAEYYSSEENTAQAFAHMNASVSAPSNDLPAHVTAKPKRVNIGGVVKTTFDVDMGMLPEGGSWHYGSQKDALTTKERNVLDRWRQQSDEVDAAEAKSRREQQIEDQKQENIEGLSATAVPALAHDEPPVAPQVSAAPVPGAGNVRRDGSVTRVSLTAPSSNRISIEEFFLDRVSRASRVLTMIQQRDPDLALGAELNYLEAKITRQLGGWLNAEPLYNKLDGRDVPTAIRLAAKREILTHSPRITPGSVKYFAIQAAERPFLDGKASDAMWQSAISDRNVTAMNTEGEFVAFAHDQEFLFVFVRCNKRKQASGPDRVELRIDSDRDFKTTADFVISSNGDVADGWSGWMATQRKWFVATHEDGDHWSAELAIPLDELRIRTASSSGFPERLGIDLQRFDSSGRSLWTRSTQRVAQPAPFAKRADLLSTNERLTADFGMLVFQGLPVAANAAQVAGQPENAERPELPVTNR